MRSRAARRVTAASRLACCVAIGLTVPGAGPRPAAVAAQDADGRAGSSEARPRDEAFATVAERVAPSVVSIRIEAPVDPDDIQPFLREFFSDLPAEQLLEGGASGFVVGQDGSILTNNHVIERATRIRVRLADGRDLPATVVGADPATDLALIRVPARGLRPLRFADMDRHRVGDSVLAIGAPLGLDTTVTTGVLSALGRSGFGMSEIEDYVQTDATLHAGSSGGPLVDLEGNVVGVTTIVVGGAPGLSFAVSGDLAGHVAQQLAEHGRVRRAWIGLEHQELTPELADAVGAGPETRGALVTAMTDGGPAARGGLQLGDAIIGVDGTPLERALDLTRALLRRAIGARVALDIVRGGRERRVVLTTAEQPAGDAEQSPPRARPARRSDAHDLEVVPVTPDLARAIDFDGEAGAVVSSVREGGAAYHAGLRLGDVIVEADRRDVRGPEDLVPALSDDGSALLRVRRGQHAFYTVLRRE